MNIKRLGLYILVCCAALSVFTSFVITVGTSILPLFGRQPLLHFRLEDLVIMFFMLISAFANVSLLMILNPKGFKTFFEEK